jgi:tellurite resistance protein TehA-like permease
MSWKAMAVAILIIGITVFPYFLSTDIFAPLERILPYHALLIFWLLTLFLALRYRTSMNRLIRKLRERTLESQVPEERKRDPNQKD